MPRDPKPSWDHDRSRWCARVGSPRPDGRSRLVRFPRHDSNGVPITARDHAWAWAFLQKLRDHELTPTPRRGPGSHARPGPSSGPRPAPYQPVSFRKARTLFAENLDARAAVGLISPRHASNLRRNLAKLGAMRPAKESPGLDDSPLVSLDVVTLSALESSLRHAGLGPTYVSHLLQAARALTAWAARPRADSPPLIPINPLADFQPVRVAKPRRTGAFATRTDAANWFRALRARVTAAIPGDKKYARSFLLLQRFLHATGARPGEACALTWADVFLDPRQPGYPGFAVAVLPPDRWKNGSKTGRARRILLPPRISRALVREKARAVEERHPTHLFFHGPGRGGSGRDSPWADSIRLGRRLTYERRHAAKAGYSFSVHIHNYLWRHTLASNLAMSGVPLAVAAEYLGTSAEQLASVYIHIQAGELVAIAHGNPSQRAASGSPGSLNRTK
jgi:integrase